LFWFENLEKEARVRAGFLSLKPLESKQVPRRERPAETTRSERWMRVAANEAAQFLDAQIRETFDWDESEAIEWLSPILSDQYSEYYDSAFLKRLGITDLKAPLESFWPRSGPRWDGLAKTESGKYLLVEAKAYIEEGVDFRSKAGPGSLAKIHAALEEAKQAFGATEEAPWDAPFYQYANRLAHLYFLVEKNELDAYLLFLYFANAPDVPNPCSIEQWEGAKRIIEKCLGLGKHRFSKRVSTVVVNVDEMLSNISLHGTR
jgi:hypothetical protein